jgi:hypothetical protein
MSIKEQVREVIDELMGSVTYSEEDCTHLTEEEIETKYLEATSQIHALYLAEMEKMVKQVMPKFPKGHGYCSCEKCWLVREKRFLLEETLANIRKNVL